MRHKRIELNDQTDSFDKIKADLDRRKKHERKTKRRRFIKRSIMVSLLVCFLLAGYKFDQWEGSRLNKIHVKGNALLSDSEVVSLSKLKKNDRMILNWSGRVQRRLNKNEYIKDSHVKIIYKDQTALLQIEEETPIAYEKTKKNLIYFENGAKIELDDKNIKGIDALPLLVNIKDDALKNNIISQLKTVDEGSRIAISEIIHIEDKFEKESVKLVMNNGYYVFTSVETLPLLNNYATIISGAEPKNKCIYLLEYGPTEDTQVATAKPCDFEN
ncbi:cell division protein FtsQ/DivIB [Erysipelothrix urinaevulpis]|uniref:cell division protein FtsQ/DivIB n=1 Tax=Erysipelothrix urinaevulpis TaxID=2683717 RepID=UPI00135B38CE|nr:FtsQ-type POTRA domain-containing protein [Erysipelothrix urinaevulpis]